MCFRASFLPPFFPHFAPFFLLQALFALPPPLPSSPPPLSPLFLTPGKLFSVLPGDIVFQLPPIPPTYRPPPPTPPFGESILESFFGRFRVVFESILSRFRVDFENDRISGPERVLASANKVSQSGRTDGVVAFLPEIRFSV